MKDQNRARISSSTAHRAAMATVLAAAAVIVALYASSAQQRPKQERLETELITLQPGGF